MLLALGHEVTIIDNLSTGRKSNIFSFKSNKNLNFVEADIRDKDSIDQFFHDQDFVYHLAGLADIVPSIERPEEYFSTNVEGTLNVLSSCVKYGVKKLVYAASSSSYGIPKIYPTPEDSPISPKYPYALTKYMGEELCMHWSEVYSLPVVSLRLFNVFGTRSRTAGAYGAVFGVFLAQKLANKPLTIVGDGCQTRDFTYVTDVAQAFIDASLAEIESQCLNVGSGNHYSVNYLANLLGGKKVYIPKRPGEPDCTFADIKAIKEKLNWSPKISFEEGVQKILENISDWNDAPVWSPESIEIATESWFKHLK